MLVKIQGLSRSYIYSDKFQLLSIKALKMDSWNSKGFQDAYEPCLWAKQDESSTVDQTW